MFSITFDSKPSFADAFSGFKVKYGRNIGTLLLVGIKIVLWTILFIIPGIIKTYEYAIIPYILADDAEISSKDAFKKAGKLLFVGYMMKYHNLHQKAKQLIANGEIGQVVDVRAQFSCWYPDIEGAWRQQKKLGGGGAIMDLAVHCMELVSSVCDDEIIKSADERLMAVGTL